MKKAKWLWIGLGVVVIVGGFVTAIRSLANHPATSWNKTLGGSFDDSVKATAVDINGNYVTLGIFNGTGVDLDISAASHTFNAGITPGVYLSKYLSNNNYAWAITLNGNGSTITPTSVTTDNNGGVYFSGYIDYTNGDPQIDMNGTGGTDPTNFSSSGTYGFVSKYDANGNYNWTRILGSNNGNVYGNSIAIGASGDIYVTGGFLGTAVQFDTLGGGDTKTADDKDMFITKLSTDGNYIWTGTFGGLGTDGAYKIAADGGGYLYVSGGIRGSVNFGGTVLNPVGTEDGVLLKLTETDGSVSWVRQLSGFTGDEILAMKALTVDHANDIYIGGYFLGSASNLAGQQYVNGGGPGTSDAILVKYDSTGNLLWQHEFGGTGSEIINSLAVDGSNNVFITGSFESTVDFDTGAAVNNHSSNGQNDIFVTKFDASGNYGWTKTAGGTGYERGNDIAIDLTNKIYVGGEYSSINVDFGEAGAPDVHSTNGGYDGVLMLLTDSPDVTDTPTGTGTTGVPTDTPTLTPTETPTLTPTGTGATGSPTDTPTPSPTGVGGTSPSLTPSPTPTGVGATTITVSDFNPTTLYGNGQLLLPSGETLSDSTQVEFPNQLTINIGQHQVILPAGLEVTALSAGDSFNVTLMRATSVDLNSMQNLNNKIAAVEWGIPNYELALGSPIQISLYIPGAYEGQTLQVRRSTDGVNWTTDGLVVTSCLVSSNICAFTASRASYYIAYDPGSSTSNYVAPNYSQGPPGPPACTDAGPESAPDLFRIEVTKKQAKIFFTPVRGSVNYYYIAYSAKNTNAEEHGVMFNKGPYPGEISFTVNNLQLNKKYYFKVRGGNGCTPGGWSNILTAKTSSGSRKLIYYKPVPKPTVTKKK